LATIATRLTPALAGWRPRQLQQRKAAAAAPLRYRRETRAASTFILGMSIRVPIRRSANGGCNRTAGKIWRRGANSAGKATRDDGEERRPENGRRRSKRALLIAGLERTPPVRPRAASSAGAKLPSMAVRNAEAKEQTQAAKKIGRQHRSQSAKNNRHRNRVRWCGSRFSASTKPPISPSTPACNANRRAFPRPAGISTAVASRRGTRSSASCAPPPHDGERLRREENEAGPAG